MKQRKIVFISLSVLLGFLLFAGIAGIGIYRLLSGTLFDDNPSVTPSQLKQARVVLGDSFLSRSQFVKTGKSVWEQALKGPDIGSVSDIAIRQPDPGHALRIVIAGRVGAMIVDSGGLKQSELQYDLETEQRSLGPFTTTKTDFSIGDIQVVDFNGNGGYEFLGRGDSDGAVLFDKQGRRVWTYHKSGDERFSLHSVTIADLNGDGQNDFIISSNGIKALDKHGKLLWQREAEFGPSQIEVVDIDDTGEKKIVSFDGMLDIRDELGNIIKSFVTPLPYVGVFSLCKKPGSKIPTILVVRQGHLWLVGFDGKPVAQFDAPLSDFPDVVQKSEYGEFGTTSFKAKGVWVKLAKDQPEYLAAVANFAALDRSVLYVYTPQGQLVYQEVLPEYCSSIVSLPPQNVGDTQDFLVGGSDTVWRYKAK